MTQVKNPHPDKAATQSQVESLSLSKQSTEVWTEGSVDLNALQASIQFPSPTSDEPRLTVGSEEWHRRRRESHKLVERKRREAINQGINAIARCVPGCEKNKGSILHRAVEYIQQLKGQEAALIEKTANERLCAERDMLEIQHHTKHYQEQIDPLANQVERYQQDLEIAHSQNLLLKKRLEELGS